MAKRESPNKEVTDLVKELRRQGWEVEKRKSNHIKATPPSGKGCVFFPCTPSDWRSLKNTKAKLKEMGANNMDRR